MSSSKETEYIFKMHVINEPCSRGSGTVNRSMFGKVVAIEGIHYAESKSGILTS
jgi:hypothetical protein